MMTLEEKKINFYNILVLINTEQENAFDEESMIRVRDFIRNADEDGMSALWTMYNLLEDDGFNTGYDWGLNAPRE